MKQTHGKKLVVSSLFFLFLIAFAGTAKAGLDYYEIYLGKQLLLKRYLNEPLNLQTLALSEANANEQLVIRYYQCNAPGRQGANRSIALRDETGKTVKQWRYADGHGNATGMSIPVKELLQWQKQSGGKRLGLFYTADGRSEGETLAFLPAGGKAVSSLLLFKDGANSGRFFLTLPVRLALPAII